MPAKHAVLVLVLGYYEYASTRVHRTRNTFRSTRLNNACRMRNRDRKSVCCSPTSEFSDYHLGDAKKLEKLRLVSRLSTSLRVLPLAVVVKAA